MTIRTLLTATALFCPCLAAAQPPTPPAGTAGDQFERRPDPQSQPTLPIRIERPQAGQALAGIAFEVRQVVVEGAVRVNATEIAAITASLEGRTVTLTELARAADAITALYARRGYALSFAFVPEQTVADGIVRLRVVEGTVDEISVDFGNGAVLVGRRRIEAAVRRRFEALTRAGPVRSRDLERAILEVNDLSGLEASVIVRPSETVEGAANLVVLLNLDPVDAELGADNRLRAEFAREEVFASVSLNSVLTVGDRISLSGRRSIDGDAFTYGAIGYETQLGHSATRLSAFYSWATTEAKSGLLGVLEFEGREDSYRLGIRHPLLRSRARSLFVSAELAGVDTRSSLIGVPIVRDNVRTIALGVSYDWSDETGAVSLASAQIVQGLDWLGATNDTNPLRSRANGEPDAAYLTARLFRDQPLPAGLRIRADSEAQLLLAGDGLLAASECTFGGPAIGRGYDAGAISGDECWRGSVELARPIAAGRHVVEPYAFIDGGIAWQTGMLQAGEQRRREAASFGVGVRLFTRFGLSADLQITQPARSLFPGDPKDARFFFTVSFRR